MGFALWERQREPQYHLGYSPTEVPCNVESRGFPVLKTAGVVTREDLSVSTY